MKRALVIVLDGFGIGEMPDAKLFGDQGSNTFLNIQKINPMHIPNLMNLGLGNIDGVNLNTSAVLGNYARLSELSIGKDTTTGHYEMMNIITTKPSPTFPNGFPKALISKLEKSISTKVLGNYASSGTEIIKVLGEEHLKTGYPIIYTSADSVLQVATHIDRYSLTELYDLCEKIRKLMVGEYEVSRVIARPFAGEYPNFYRLPDRKDFALTPPKSTLNILQDNNIKVCAVGKIEDIFKFSGIDESTHTHSNIEAINSIKSILKNKSDSSFIFANLCDTDMLYGHRNDIVGYKKSIEEFDRELKNIIDLLKNDDILIITGDHGCDPTTISTDHSREYTPLIVYGKSLKSNINLGTLLGFNSISKILLSYFNIESSELFNKIK